MALPSKDQREDHWFIGGNAPPRLSFEYILNTIPICLRLLAQLARLAASRARANAGSRIAARIPMMAITTNNSIKVKPLLMFMVLLSWNIQLHYPRVAHKETLSPFPIPALAHLHLYEMKRLRSIAPAAPRPSNAKVQGSGTALNGVIALVITISTTKSL